MRHVLLIGAGALGMRYVEGFEARNDCLIFVHDILERDLSGFQNAMFIENLDCVSSTFLDLVIVATTAKGRAEILINILDNLIFSKILLEKPVEQSVEKLDLIVKNNSAGMCYVNLARRCSLLYFQLKNILETETVVKIVVTGKNFGIACNGLHFIDLAQYLTGQTPQGYAFFDQPLNWVKAKREGFYEAHGKIVIQFSGFDLEIVDEHINNGVLISIQTLRGLIIVDEQNGLISGGAKISINLGPRHIPYVSEYARDLVAVNDEPGFDLGGLPSLSEVYTAQKLHLDLLSKSWSEYFQSESGLVPAT